MTSEEQSPSAGIENAKKALTGPGAPCSGCGRPIPRGKRRHAVTCSASCRVLSSRARRAARVDVSVDVTVTDGHEPSRITP